MIAYYSKSLNPAQQKYCTTRRELLAVVATLDHFKGYVWGPKFSDTDRSCCASLAEEFEKHPGNASTLAGQTATISF